jgi:hypothetical protein
MKSFRSHVLIGAALMALATSASAKNVISGQIIDRNGEPVNRAIVSLDPGNVQLVTDRLGNFTIDYLRDEDGERVKLRRKTDYRVEVFKPGYHTQAVSLYFKRGEILMEAITVVEDTIEIQDHGENLDSDLFKDSTHSAGANYEGQ